jgi:hypothetical protein
VRLPAIWLLFAVWPAKAVGPSPSLAPADVVRIVMTALQHNDSPLPNAGIFTAYAFASPANHAATGPYGHFLGLVRTAEYEPLLHPHPFEGGNIAMRGDFARQIVTIHLKTGDVWFRFRLRRQQDGACRGCWMIDGVSKRPGPN